MSKKLLGILSVIGVVAVGVIGYTLVQDMDEVTDKVEEKTEEVIDKVDDEVQEIGEEVEEIQEEVAGSSAQVVNLGENNLNPLSQGSYELWATSQGQTESLGVFNISPEGELVGESGVIAGGEFTSPFESTIENLSISIEPQNDTDPASSGTLVVSGSATDDTLNYFDADLTLAQGEYITGTPSNDPEGLENAGLWFAVPGNPPTASLKVPDLTDTNWTYEGWVRTKGTLLSAGRFKVANSGDTFSGFNASTRVPNLPGEDFLINLPTGLQTPVNLGDGASEVLVTVEPDVNGVDPTGDGPYGIVLLNANIPLNLVDHTLQPLTTNTAKIPFVNFTIK